MCAGRDTHFVDEGKRGNHNSRTALQLHCVPMQYPSELGLEDGDKHWQL